MWWPEHKKHEKQINVTIVEQTDYIIIEGQPYKKHNPRDIDIIETLVRIVNRLTTHPEIKLVLTQNLNNTKSIIMSLSLSSKQFAIGGLGLVDTTTQQAISASFSNQSFGGSDDGIIKVEQDPNDANSVKVSGVGEGSAQVNFSADVSYTSANTGQAVTKNLSGTVGVSVSAVVSGQDVSLVVNFGEPQDQ